MGLQSDLFKPSFTKISNLADFQNCQTATLLEDVCDLCLQTVACNWAMETEPYQIHKTQKKPNLVPI